MITSFFPGRIRLRAPVFKDQVLVAKAEAVLKSAPQLKAALKSVQSNLVTGSVLIEYDSQKVSAQDFSGLEGFLLRLEAEAKNYDGSRRAEILALLEAVEKELKAV